MTALHAWRRAWRTSGLQGPFKKKQLAHGHKILNSDWPPEQARCNFIKLPAPWLGKMNQILCCDWLPEQARWSYPTCSEIPTVSCKKNFHKSHITNPVMVKLGQSRWLSMGLVLFFRVNAHLSHLINKLMMQKKNSAKYPAILTPCLVNNPLQMISFFQLRNTQGVL